MNKNLINPNDFDINQIRNIAIIAHIDAGKTTLTERIIYYANAMGKHQVGDVHKGNTTTDYLEQERKRGITIVSAAVKFIWNNHLINLIDSPGHVDFTIEVERCLSVLESAILVIDGSSGVQPQTECVWRQAVKFNISMLVFINKLDKEGADFYFSVNSLKTRLSSACIPVQVPYLVDEKFIGLYDLLAFKLHIWEGRDHIYQTIEYNDFNDDQKSEFQKARFELIESVAMLNEELMEKYLENENIDNDLLIYTIACLCRKTEIYPVFCGSAFHNKGVQMLLDAIINFLPDPTNSSNSIQEMRSKIDNSIVKIDFKYPHTVLFCFKWCKDKHIGAVSYCRIYSGSLKIGDIIYSYNNNKKIRIINLLTLFANKYINLKECKVGDIVGLVGQDIITGDVLSPDHLRLYMHKINVPESVVHIAIRPKTEADQDRFSKSIADYMKEDPTISFEYSDQKETILKGIGSLQLDVLASRMQTEKNINLDVSKPKVSYRTTISSSYTGEYLHRKQTGGSGQYAKVVLKLEPYVNEGKEFEFINLVKGGNVPEQYVPSVKAALEDFLKVGIFNCKVINIKATLLDGDHHKVDSSDLAFREATRICVLDMIKHCNPYLLEPYAKVNIVTPNQYADKIIGDVCSKGGNVLSLDNDKFNDSYRILIVELPMKFTFDYIDYIRCLSSGYASCSYEFSHYKQASEQPEINF